MNGRWALKCLLSGVIAACAFPVFGGEQEPDKLRKDLTEPLHVEFYPAIENGQISVGVIAND